MAGHTDLPHDSVSERLGLAAAARAAAMLSREIAYADPDPLTMAELDDRIHRYATTLMTVPHDVLLRPVVADWRRVQAALGRRLSLAAHRELARAAGYLSFYLGLLAADTGDDPSARRFATLAEQFAAQVDDDLLTGTVATLDAMLAIIAGRCEAALHSAQRALAVAHPYLQGWALMAQARAAAALGDTRQVAAARRGLTERPCVRGLRHPGWPPFDEVCEALLAAEVALVTGERDAAALACAAVDQTEPGTLERGWALAALAGALAAEDPPAAVRLLGEVDAILRRTPSRLLADRLEQVSALVRAAGTAGPAGAVTAAGAPAAVELLAPEASRTSRTSVSGVPGRRPDLPPPRHTGPA